ncbi:MAG: hydroxyisourate hydrolase [Pseudomonadota bacterium]|nr:hydroxyisourate hydrolase [Pseudomonadota bacterium]
MARALPEISISTHVLDLSSGLPAVDVQVSLSVRTAGIWKVLATARTDSDGRVRQWGLQQPLMAGVYSLSFGLTEYFERKQMDAFFPVAELHFKVTGNPAHLHVPLLLNAYGYSTYRGS